MAQTLPLKQRVPHATVSHRASVCCSVHLSTASWYLQTVINPACSGRWQRVALHTPCADDTVGCP